MLFFDFSLTARWINFNHLKIFSPFFFLLRFFFHFELVYGEKMMRFAYGLIDRWYSIKIR